MDATENRNVSVEKAVELMLRCGLPVPTAETVPLAEALGRTAFDDLDAPFDQPPFPRSPLDGYAVRHEDLAGASPVDPIRLSVIGEVFAGHTPFKPVCAGEAMRIMTGAPIPKGADCVVRQEDTDCGEREVLVYTSLSAYENYCFAGEDVTKGTRAISRGDLLTFTEIGALASLGLAEIRVSKRPRVALLTTGDELIGVGAPLVPGKIYNSNQYLLAARLRELGAEPAVSKIGGDDPAGLSAAVLDAVEKNDLLVTTGGVSVGKKDFMPAVCERLGGKLIFKGVSLKPGTPAMAFEKNGKIVLCLSGNPFASAATFELLARPLIGRLLGRNRPDPVRVRGILQNAFCKGSPNRRFLRAKIVGNQITLPGGEDSTQRHSSGMIHSMMGCNCLVDLPAGTGPLAAGQTVEAVLF